MVYKYDGSSYPVIPLEELPKCRRCERRPYYHAYPRSWDRPPLLTGQHYGKSSSRCRLSAWTGVAEAALGQVEDEPQIRWVACAIDFGPASVSIIRWAGALAQAFRASLTILHASPKLEPVIGVIHAPEWCAHLASLLRGEMEKLISDLGIEADIRLDGGKPAKTVTAMAAELNADVLVLGRPVANRFLATAAHALLCDIRQSPCPVTSV
jgi:nucleotide-binding universal stress UspA family protein